jgi:titin
VLIQNGAHANTIGGTSVADRNTICGNITNQVEITGKGSSANVVEGNYIGIDSSGESAVQEGGDGVLITASATGNRIGGTAAGAGNLIGGMGLWTFGKPAGAGVYLSGTGTSGNTIQGNWIGLDSRGVAALKDSGGGVIAVDVGYNTVGGSGSARNVIGDATNSPGLSRTDNILPVGWAFDSILYLEHPDLLGGSFRA